MPDNPDAKKEEDLQSSENIEIPPIPELQRVTRESFRFPNAE
jgi:hypothetical protein